MWRVAWVRVSAGENAHVIIVRWPHGDASRAETPPDTTSMLPRITHRPPRIRKCRLGCIQRAWGTGLTATAGSLTLTLTRVLSLKPRCSNSLCPPASVRSLSWALRHSNRMLELAQWRRGRGCAGGLTAAYVSRTCHWVVGRMLLMRAHKSRLKLRAGGWLQKALCCATINRSDGWVREVRTAGGACRGYGGRASVRASPTQMHTHPPIPPCTW